MFKKRTRPASVRDRPSSSSAPLDSPLASASGTPDPQAGPSGSSALPDANATESAIAARGGDEGEEDETAANIDELIMLRKLRKAKPGIDLERLNRGEEKRRKQLEASERYGLQSQKSKKKGEGEDGDEWGDEAERVKRLVRNNNFTQQTNALDVDKHMMAYIETELAKRRGNTTAEGYQPTEAYDPQAELFKLAEKYKWDNRGKKEDEEGNVTNSLGMLTSIPEVDLGMDNRLRNIEATEKAKRDMMEARKAELAARRRPEDIDFSSARFHRPNLRIASDIYAIDDAKREAAGLPPPNRPRNSGHEQATDEAVYERFKKRMRR